jgi:hypothetical protein
MSSDESPLLLSEVFFRRAKRRRRGCLPSSAAEEPVSKSPSESPVPGVRVPEGVLLPWRDWVEKRRLMKPGKVRTRLLAGREAVVEVGVEGGLTEELAEEGFEPVGSTTIEGTGGVGEYSSRAAGELSEEADSWMAGGKLK